MLDSKSSQDSDTVLSDLQPVVEAYQLAESNQAKVAILTLAPKIFKTSEIMHFFQCSKRKIYNAETWKKKYGPASINTSKRKDNP